MIIYSIDSITNASAAFNASYKLYNDYLIPIIEAIINIITSIIFIYYIGLFGVIIGTIISLIISFIWKPIYLHKKGFKVSIYPYIKFTLYIILLGIISSILSIESYKVINTYIPNISFYHFSLKAVITAICVTSIFFIVYFILSNTFRNFLNRIKTLYGY